jgi:hypothetical protein
MSAITGLSLCLRVLTVTNRRNGAKNAADLAGDSVFISWNELNSPFWYDFRKMRIGPTAYSIRAHYHGGPGWSYRTNWIVGRSTDGIDWIGGRLLLV